MATSSITRNFVIEGKNAIDFAESLDAAIKEKEERGTFIQKGVFTSDKEKIKEATSRIFRHV